MRQVACGSVDFNIYHDEEYNDLAIFCKEYNHKVALVTKWSIDDLEYINEDTLMVEIVKLKKHDGKTMDLYNKPLHWCKGILDGEEVIDVSCINGHVSFLQHRVKDNGEVHPSLLCEDCGWHVWGILEGWNVE